VVGLLLFSLTGCGKRGQPLPPSLVVPKKISDLRLVARPGESFLVWNMPKVNSDGTKPVDLNAFKIRLKKVAKGLDSCRYCDEGFFDYLTINLLKPEAGYQVGSSFYLPLPEIEKNFIYVFSVSSLNSRGWDSESSNKLAVFALPEILPPTKVELTPSASMVELNWQAIKLPVDFTGKLFYRVYRRQPEKPDSSWRLITPEPIADNHFIDVGLHDWRAYEYVVTAIVTLENTSSQSAYSAVAHVIPGDYTAPEKLENFSAFYYEAGIQLIWDPSTASDLSGYNVYRRDEVTGIDHVIAVLPPSHSEFFDSSIISGRTYYYRVTAFDLSDRKNESESTVEISVTAK
jgi:hypothetical protein